MTKSQIAEKEARKQWESKLDAKLRDLGCPEFPYNIPSTRSKMWKMGLSPHEAAEHLARLFLTADETSPILGVTSKERQV